jgi:signal transduction histidine kinase
VLDAVPSAICVVNPEGLIIDANASWKKRCSVAGFPDVGGNLLDAWDAQDHQGAAALAAGVREVIAGAIPAFTSDYARSENGHEHWYRLTATLTSGRGGSAVITETGIISWRHVEADLRPGEEHTLQAQKMEAVGRLAGGVAHDFNNLLTLISGYTEILLARMAPADPYRPEIEEIRKAANRGAGLTSQLLAFSRRQKVEPRVLDLNQLVADMERMLRRMIGEDVTLVAELAPAVCKIKADPGQIGQVIMNLVLNARDAMPRGGRITIRTSNVDLKDDSWLARGQYVCLSLEDTGHGMDEGTLQHLFEPFFTTKDPGKGTGLGLSTVYGIVKQSQGDVRVESEPGQGSRFLIYLPAASERVETVSGRDSASATAAGTETVLLVEDEASVRRLLKHVLTKQGYHVLEASSGEEAVEIYDRHSGPIDLLLTDMVMPRMNGRELANQLVSRQESLRVLYVSGYTDDVLIRNGALGPGMYFLQKPLKPHILTAKVREVLDGSADSGDE